MNDTHKPTSSGDDTVELYDTGRAIHTKKGEDAENAADADKDSGLWDEGQPFHTTHFGKVPAEIREKILINLLALPPPYAGRNIAIQGSDTSYGSSANGREISSNTSCYHLKKSWLKALQTCRQIYLEAFPIFYGRKSYYTANAQELVTLSNFGRSGPPGPLTFRGDGITSLCVKGLVRYVTDAGWGALEGATCIFLDRTISSAASKLWGWENLRKICLCMRAGEEDFYTMFLFRLPGLRHGVVDFLDDSHWSIHPQYRGSEWKIQYTCYGDETCDLEDIRLVSVDKINACRVKMQLESHASGLKIGEERYVEVDIARGENAEHMTEEEVKAAIESTKDRETAAVGMTERDIVPRSQKRRVCCSLSSDLWPSSWPWLHY